MVATFMSYASRVSLYKPLPYVFPLGSPRLFPVTRLHRSAPRRETDRGSPQRGAGTAIGQRPGPYPRATTIVRCRADLGARWVRQPKAVAFSRPNGPREPDGLSGR